MTSVAKEIVCGEVNRCCVFVVSKAITYNQTNNFFLPSYCKYFNSHHNHIKKVVFSDFFFVPAPISLLAATLTRHY